MSRSAPDRHPHPPIWTLGTAGTIAALVAVLVPLGLAALVAGSAVQGICGPADAAALPHTGPAPGQTASPDPDPAASPSPDVASPVTSCALPVQSDAVADPTGTGGFVTPATAALVAAGRTAFPSSDWTCWSPRPGTDSDHPRGRACDVTFGNAIGQAPTPAQREEGWRFARWLRDHAHELNVQYVIWQARIWNIDRDEEGWRAYGGGGIHDPTSVTGGHIDHVHVSLSR